MSYVGGKSVSGGNAKNVVIDVVRYGKSAWLDTFTVIDLNEPKVTVPTRSLERVAPDGGYGWFVSVMTFVVTFLLTGFLKSFAVWRAAIMEEFPNTSTMEASWISERIGTLSLICSPFSSALVARFGNGVMVSVGSIICALGFLISYFATSAGYLIGSLGVGVGVGSSFVITSAVGCTGKFFTTREPTAMSIALSGGCLGVIVMPYLLEPIFRGLGLHSAFLVLSGTFFLLSLSGMIYANPESHFALKEKDLPFEEEKEESPVPEGTFWERSRSKIAELMALRYLRRPQFLTMAISVFALNMGSPHFLRQMSGRAEGLGASADSISLLTLLVQLADLSARLIYGISASESPFRRTTEYAFVLATCALCAVLAIFCNAFWQLAVLTFIGSLAAGVMNICIPLVLSYNHGASNLSNTFNLARCFQGLSLVIYRFVSPEIPTADELPSLLILNGVFLWFGAILSIVVCFFPREETERRYVIAHDCEHCLFSSSRS